MQIVTGTQNIRRNLTPEKIHLQEIPRNTGEHKLSSLCDLEPQRREKSI